MKLKKIFSIFLLLIMLLCSLSVCQSKISKTENSKGILYVGGTGPDNYTSIQLAIDVAGGGDTVFVFSGIYQEHVSIYKRIQLIGEDRESTIIDGNATGNAVSITYDNVTVDSFTIKNGENGIYLDEVSNCTISNNLVKENYKEGIRFYSSCDYNIVDNNVISDNEDVGLKFSSFSDYNKLTNNVIKNNLNGSSFAGFAYGEITGNSFEGNTEYGLVFNLWCNENEIHNNNFIGNKINVFFFTSSLNKWNNNYWDRPRILPKPILGLMGFIPFLNFDWRPLLTPAETQ